MDLCRFLRGMERRRPGLFSSAAAVSLLAASVGSKERLSLFTCWLRRSICCSRPGSVAAPWRLARLRPVRALQAVLVVARLEALIIMVGWLSVIAVVVVGVVVVGGLLLSDMAIQNFMILLFGKG